MSSEKPPPNDLDRQAFYADEPPVSGSDHNRPEQDDYEVEPIDPEVLSAERRRTREVAAAAEAAVDVDSLYRDAESRYSDDYVRELIQTVPGRFQIKHMLIGTAVLAILLTLPRLVGPCGAVFLVGLFGLGGSYGFLIWRERQRSAQAAERRRRAYAKQQAQRADKGDSDDQVDDRPSVVEAHVPPNETDIAWREAMSNQAGFEFTFAFSVKQLLGTFTFAAVVLGLLIPIGASNGALILGLIALIGLGVHAVGVQPPPIVTLGWWLLLLLYILVSIVAIFVPGA